eukprot:3235064-Prymnesium_polylepis.1
MSIESTEHIQLLGRCASSWHGCGSAAQVPLAGGYRERRLWRAVTVWCPQCGMVTRSLRDGMVGDQSAHNEAIPGTKVFLT